MQRVLIADDDPDIVRLFRRMLSTRIPVQNCLEAYSGSEALQLLAAEKPDLVLLDLIMPEVDGRDVLDQMARDPSLARIPVIIVSVKAQDYLSLPLPGSIQVSRPGGFDLGELVSTLEAVFKALAPGWSQLHPTGPAPAEALAGSAASADRSPRPAPVPVAAG